MPYYYPVVAVEVVVDVVVAVVETLVVVDDNRMTHLMLEKMRSGCSDFELKGMFFLFFRVATKIFEDFGRVHYKECIIGR